MQVYVAFTPKFCMEYPISVGKKHSQTGYRRNGLDGSTHLVLYGYTEDMKFTSERISKIRAFSIKYLHWPRLFRDYEVQCDSCPHISKLFTTRYPKYWECAKCRQSEPDIAFN